MIEERKVEIGVNIDAVLILDLDLCQFSMIRF
jgi:hypothetical protein